MIIDYSDKLDFQDVLIRPKRSTLESRSQVDLLRTFKPKYGAEFSCVPIIAANMATGTFNMLTTLSKEKLMTAVAKHHNQEWFDFVNRDSDGLATHYLLSYGFYTIGMSDAELAKLQELYNIINNKFGENFNLKICIDIANGYTQRFASFVEKVRKSFPNHVIVAGNVATPEMVQELIINGADFIKIGIGPGCFIPGTKVQTTKGLKKIEDIIIGDQVQTHLNRFSKVLNTIKYQEPEKVIVVNGIKSTEHHEYYVISKKDKDKVTESNLTMFAFWIPAEKLNKEEHLLISFTN